MGRLTDAQLARLRTLRGYTEDEALLAAMAADEIERLRKILSSAEETLRTDWSQEAATRVCMRLTAALHE